MRSNGFPIDVLLVAPATPGSAPSSWAMRNRILLDAVGHRALIATSIEDHGTGPVDCLSAIEFRLQKFMQALPDAGRLPGAQPAPARHAAAATHLLRQVFPTDPGLQHKDDAGQCAAVVDRFAPRKAKAARFRLW